MWDDLASGVGDVECSRRRVELLVFPKSRFFRIDSASETVSLMLRFIYLFCEGEICSRYRVFCRNREGVSVVVIIFSKLPSFLSDSDFTFGSTCGVERGERSNLSFLVIASFPRFNRALILLVLPDSTVLLLSALLLEVPSEVAGPVVVLTLDLVLELTGPSGLR